MYPDLKTLSQYRQYPYVPVSVRQTLDHFQPRRLIMALHALGSDCCAFTVTSGNERCSYFGSRPQASMTYNDGRLTVTCGGKTTVQHIDIHKYLKRLMHDYRTPKITGMPLFSGGLLGYFSYDYAKYNVNRLHLAAANPDGLQDLGLLLLDSVIVYDHRKRQLLVTKLIATANLKQNYQSAEYELTELQQRVSDLLQRPVELPEFSLTSKLTPLCSMDEYEKQVENLQQHIYAGDIFQIIYSNPLIATMHGSLLRVYLHLIEQNPSPYEIYYCQGEFEAAGASPETLIKKSGRRLATYPLAGTRRRGIDDAEDASFERELINSPKERAEHNMLVDLGRNDLGRVAEFGSVHVTEHMKIVKFSQVMHLRSTVVAAARQEIGNLDALNAAFPAGTLSGAPKVRAMELIDEYEQRKRGLYGGCFGYLDFNGDADMSIGIRLAHRTGRHLTVHAGAGIVSDSIGRQEYRECFNKARAVVKALQTAEEDIHAAVD